MPKKAGPSLLCEWMVGTSIQSALGPPPKASKPKPRPKKRDLIKLHVTTDDESGEDTLTITYPRYERLNQGKETPAAVPEPAAPDPGSESEVTEVVKKVRFEKEPASSAAVMPKKSAMKKKTLVTFCEEEETTSDSGGDVTSTSASSGEVTPDASSSNESSAADTSSAGDTSSDESSKAVKASRSKKYPKSRKIEKPAQSSDSEADSDPHPTCKCKECTTERTKRKQEPVCEKKKCKKNEKTVSAKKAEPETEPESETSASEAESSADEKPPPPKKAKENKKGKKKVEVSDTEGETSESAKEEDVPKKTQERKKNKNEKGGKKVDSSKNEGETKTEEAKKDAEKEKEETAKSEANKGKDKEADDSKKPTAEATSLPYATKYADGHPYSHARPPNLIAPIRAEMMHTERVVETQDDPLPNAYYDALHNVVRVYHGSVYGQNGRHMFANREGTSGQPHHPDMSHQMQNPYYSSYNNVMPLGPPPLPPQQQQLPIHGYEHVPITQGMPMPGWNAMVPPPGYPPYNYYGGLMPPPWYEQQFNKQGRGALDMNGTPDGKRGKSKSQEPDNNVMPEVTKPNPYYTKRVSAFSNMGSNRSPSNGKPPSNSGNSKNGKDDAPNWDTASRRSVGAWANSSNQGGATWGDAAPVDTNNNTGGGDQWGTGGGSGGGDAWNATSNDNQWNNTGGDQWGGGNNGAWNGSGNDQNTQNAWNTGDNANTGGTWGDSSVNNQQQTNDNSGNDGNQNQGQSSPPAVEKDPTPAMIDNNVAPVVVTTASSEEQSKMPGSWCSEHDGQAAFVNPSRQEYQPPSVVPAWGDPSMAANTGGQVDW
ncbi:hypothetical protein GGI43DRAFT_433170 [Trichoderma evansii]